MAKRFIDTELNRQSMRGVDVKLRFAQEWLWANCDAAGVWKVDAELFRFECGYKLDIQGLLKTCPRVKMLPNGSLFLLDFAPVNYGVLKPGYNPHKPVFRSLEANGIDPSTLHFEDLPNPSPRVEEEGEGEEEDNSGRNAREGGEATKSERKGPDPGVQAVMDHLLATLRAEGIAQSLDVDAVYKGGKSHDGNRFAAASLLKKLATDYPDFDPVESAKTLINRAVKMPFHRPHCTKVRYLLNHCGTIAEQSRQAKSNPKTQSDEDRKRELAAEALRRFGQPT